MIRKLRIKFIIINMVTVLFVLFIAFSCNYLFNRANMYEESVGVMTNALKTGKPENMKAFLVSLTNYDRIYQISGYPGSTYDDREEIESIVKKVLDRKKEQGDIPSEHIRYMVESTPQGRRVVIYNTVNEEIAANGILKYSVIIGATCALVLLGFSIYMSRLTTAPVEKSLTQKKQLVSDASHELKTPITAIIASAEVLMDSDRLDDETRGWVESIRSSAKDVSALVNNMLSLAKSEEDSPQLPQEDIDISEIAETAALNYECVLFEAGKQFETDIDSGMIIKGNAAQIKQLIAIFTDNAVKYSFPRGTVRLSLKREKGHAVLSVFDTGEPIPEDEQSKIFDRFYRVDKVRSTASGYGLGLSIARNIAELHSAKISVASGVTGTTFSVVFKLR